jgi:hypothetical protein
MRRVRRTRSTSRNEIVDSLVVQEIVEHRLGDLQAFVDEIRARLAAHGRQ